MTTSRYRIRRVPLIHERYDSISHPYGIWDTVAKCFVDKHGTPDENYWSTSREVAIMRRRDLNHSIATQRER